MSHCVPTLLFATVVSGGLFSRDYRYTTQITSGHREPPGSYVAITSPRITDRGDWYGWTFCLPGMFVVGVSIQVDIFDVDDRTGLNAVKLQCAPLGKTIVYETLQSSPDLFGDWREFTSCSRSVLTGFELRSEKAQGAGDNTGANNLRMLCSDMAVKELQGTTHGSWPDMQACPVSRAVCGIRTQFEQRKYPHDYDHDNTAVNNVDMACCPLNPIDCTATDSWLVLGNCNNRNATTNTLDCFYEQTIGVDVRNVQADITPREQELWSKIVSEVGQDLNDLYTKFSRQIGMSPRTGYSWNIPMDNSYSKARTIRRKITVGPGLAGHVKQVVGVCGANKVYTTKIVAEPY